MAELYLGVKIEGAEADVAALQEFFEGTRDLNFKTLNEIFSRITKLTITKITVSPKTISEISEKILLQAPSP